MPLWLVEPNEVTESLTWSINDVIVRTCDFRVRIQRKVVHTLFVACCILNTSAANSCNLGSRSLVDSLVLMSNQNTG